MQPRAVREKFTIEQIVPYFQAIFDLNTFKVKRYECLSRLVTPNQHIYLPSEFLYIISRSQSTAELTQRMFELSNAYCSGRNMQWSINMFNTDLRDASLMQWLQSLFKHANKQQVGVELSYNSVKYHPHLLHNIIEKLPHLHLCVDDVHDDALELKSILAAGVHAIKLRGEIITDFAKTRKNQKIITNVLQYCEEAKCPLIAEHIEDESSLKAVKELGIQYGQGFYLSHPKGRTSNLKQV